MAAEGECWSQTPEVRRLFPTFVWKAQLRPEVYEPLNALILGRLEAMRGERPPLQQGETWQSKHGLHGLPEFRSLVSCIHTAAEGVLEFLRIGSSELRITGCWANVSAPGGEHRTHCCTTLDAARQSKSKSIYDQLVHSGLLRRVFRCGLASRRNRRSTKQHEISPTKIFVLIRVVSWIVRLG